MKVLFRILADIVERSSHTRISIYFTMKDASAINKALLSKATIDTKQKVKLLCRAADVKLGQLVTIDCSWSN